MGTGGISEIESMHKQYSADRILADSRKYWPDTDDSIECFAIYLHRSHELLLKHALQTVAHLQINSSEFDVLASLRNSAPPYELTPTELQRSLLITSGGLTKLFYQLEARGLIARSVQEHDKRSKLVHLTVAGKQLVEECMDEVHKFERDLLDNTLTQKEQTQLNKLLGKVTRKLEARDGQFTDE